MAISWTKKFSSSDDGSIPTGAQLGTMQDDIELGTANALPTPGVSDGSKIARVKADHSGYEIISQVPMAAGGTGADLSSGTAGYAVVSTGTAGNMTLSPVYIHTQVVFLEGSAAQQVFCVSPVTGVVSAAYVNGYVAARGADYTITLGSAGTAIASATVTTAGVAGAVTTMTLGTVAVTAGASIGVSRTAQGSTGASLVSIVIIKTP